MFLHVDKTGLMQADLSLYIQVILFAFVMASLIFWHSLLLIICQNWNHVPYIKPGPQGNRTLLILISTEHEIHYPAHYVKMAT